MDVLHFSPEVAPYSKTGGLADVASALPRALQSRGHRTTLVTPLYAGVDRAGLSPLGGPLQLTVGAETVAVQLSLGALQGVRVVFVGHPLFDRPGIYGEGGGDYPDNFFRYALFGESMLAVPERLGFAPAVIHGHDWCCGPGILRARGRTPAKTVFTIHNLAYQGLFAPSVLRTLGWEEGLFDPEALEFYGQVSFMKAGLGFADALTTVSPTYAREIQTAALGCGLDGLLRKRSAALTGILNGIDDVEWNPRTDRHLARTYGPPKLGGSPGDSPGGSSEALAGKLACKLALQAELGLPVDPKVPLLAMVSRFTEQKGFELLTAVLDAGLLDRAQVAVLGNGDRRIEQQLLAIDRPSFSVRVAYDDGLAHRLGAGGDFFLMPSRYEPSGLSQMYAMRYGTIPVVRATGGLADSVLDARRLDGTGITFEAYTAEAFRAAIERALSLYAEGGLRPLQERGMAKDFSWAAAAAAYERLYAQLVG